MSGGGEVGDETFNRHFSSKEKMTDPGVGRPGVES